MVNSKIGWTDNTWSALKVIVREDAAEIAESKGYRSLVKIAEKNAGHVGHHCEKVSEECDECYSCHFQHRGLPYNGTGLPFDRRSRDLVEPFVDEKELLKPLSWQGKKRIFTQNQDDLFGEWFPDEMIDQVLAVAALCPQHTFQILTKRPERMRAYFAAPWRSRRIAEDVLAIVRDPNDPLNWKKPFREKNVSVSVPLQNVWLGVSAGTQKAADERIPILLDTPAEVRFVSYEPALEEVDFRPYLDRLSWIIWGGESQRGARPFNVKWAEKTVRDCAEAGVACFGKQMGAVPVINPVGDPRFVKFEPTVKLVWDIKTGIYRVYLKDKTHGADPNEWPAGLRVQQFPDDDLTGSAPDPSLGLLSGFQAPPVAG